MTLSSTSDSTVDDTSHNQNISRIPLPYIPLTTINTVPHRPLSTPLYWRVRMSGKIKRTLSDEDFTARHKFSFDIIGNELTPSAKYDFKFKDYAPWVFRTLREDSFQLDPADYLLSLTSKYILSELGSQGKLRASSRNIIQANPHTLLSRFYGLHRVKLPRGRKIHFVIMNNLFPPHKDIHETFDLKGSTVGRMYPEDMAEKNPRAVLKDLNWINRHKMLELGPEKRALLTEQLRRD